MEVVEVPYLVADGSGRETGGGRKAAACGEALAAYYAGLAALA
jgi:hypothetical protein